MEQHQFTYISEILVILLSAVFVVTIFKRMRLSPVLGYLVAGAIIGEHGLGYVQSSELSLMAELGIVFLLFAIGLELTIERLMAMRIHVFGFGSLQLILTAVTMAFIAKFFGLKTEAAIIIGGSLALSSTAIVLKVLSDANLQATQVGRLSLANLLLQDLAVAPLLVMVPLLAREHGNILLELSSATLKALIALVIIFFVGRVILRPLYAAIVSVKSNELFLSATLLVIIGSSALTQYFGLSLAMGAFVAGLLVAETQYQNQVEDNIMQFKSLLMGLFFMTVGMTINPQLIYQEAILIIILSVSIIIIKTGIIFTLARIFKLSTGPALNAGLLLSQGSEFAFILISLAATASMAIIDTNTAQILLTVVTVTMAVTPLLAKLGTYISNKLEMPYVCDEKPSEIEVADLNRHVVIVGFGRVGEMVGRLLSAKKVNYVGIDSDAQAVKKARENGFPVYHGDASKIAALKRVGVDRAKAVIVTINDNVYLKKSIRAINKEYPDIPIVARTEDLRNLATMEKIGTTVVVPEKYEAGLQMAGALLKAIGVSELEVSRLKNQFRAGNYKHAKEVMPELVE